MRKTIPVLIALLLSAVPARAEGGPPPPAPTRWTLSAGLEPSYSSLRGISFAVPLTLQYHLLPHLELGGVWIGSYLAGGFYNPTTGADRHFVSAFGPSFNYRLFDMGEAWGLVVGGGYLFALGSPAEGSRAFGTVGLEYRFTPGLALEPYLRVSLPEEGKAGVRLKFSF